MFEKLLGALVGVEHPELKIKDRLAGHGEIEMAGFDNSRVNRPYRYLKYTFPHGGPEDVALTRKSRQARRYQEVLAQRMDVRPIVVQRDSARVRVPGGLQSEPVLNLALLPVQCG